MAYRSIYGNVNGSIPTQLGMLSGLKYLCVHRLIIIMIHNDENIGIVIMLPSFLLSSVSSKVITSCLLLSAAIVSSRELSSLNYLYPSYTTLALNHHCWAVHLVSVSHRDSDIIS